MSVVRSHAVYYIRNRPRKWTVQVIYTLRLVFFLLSRGRTITYDKYVGKKEVEKYRLTGFLHSMTSMCRRRLLNQSESLLQHSFRFRIRWRQDAWAIVYGNRAVLYSNRTLLSPSLYRYSDCLGKFKTFLCINPHEISNDRMFAIYL